MNRKRKSVLVETDKQMLVKIPEHLLAEVQAAVQAKKGTATPATDVEIIKAADKSSRTRCRKLHEEIDATLHQLYAMLSETDRLLKTMTCGVDCHRSKKCVCGCSSLALAQSQMQELHKAVITLVNPPSEIPFRGKAKAKSAPPERCGVCNEYEEECGCLTFNGELPDEEEEDEDEDLSALLSLTDEDTEVVVEEHDGTRRVIPPRRHPEFRPRRTRRTEGGRFHSTTPNIEEVEPDDDG